MSEKCTNNIRDCPLFLRVEALEEVNRRHGETHREIFKRLKDTETITAVQGKHVENIDKSLDEIRADQKSILQKIETLEAKPGKRWENMVDKVLWLIVGSLISYLLLRAGLPV